MGNSRLRSTFFIGTEEKILNGEYNYNDIDNLEFDNRLLPGEWQSLRRVVNNLRIARLEHEVARLRKKSLETQEFKKQIKHILHCISTIQLELSELSGVKKKDKNTIIKLSGITEWLMGLI